MKKSIILSATLFFLIAISGITASAQTIYGVSIIQENGGTVQLYSATALDALAYDYYDAAVIGSLYLDNAQNLIAERSDSFGQVAEVVVNAPVSEDRDYFGFGDHYIIAFYAVEPTLGLWYDPYGFSLFSGEYPGEITFFGCICPTPICQNTFISSRPLSGCKRDALSSRGSMARRRLPGPQRGNTD